MIQFILDLFDPSNWWGWPLFLIFAWPAAYLYQRHIKR